MPRRKPVNPQPKLKQEDEKEDAKTGSKTGDGDNGEPPQKKALLETPGEEGATYDPTCDMNPITAMYKSEEKKTSKTEISQDGVPEIIIKSDITKLKTEDKVKAVESTSAVGQSSSVMKSNQSLQALFEAAHSELENISKQGDCDADSAITQPAVVQVTVPKVADLTSALNSGQIVIIQCDSLDPDKKSGPQVLQQLVIDKKGANKFHLPAAMSNIKLVAAEKPLDHVYGTTATEATPGDGFGYKVNETLKPMLVESTFVVPRLPMETIVAMQMPAATSVGRKRKHPQKPGKHICPYCSRGCAKPSVLQKHIRAHTGERPYPCTPCGFSFKTKSNLYKHCKSRAHTIKMGLLNANNSTAPKEVMGAVISDGSEEEVTPESPVVEENMEAFVPKTVQEAGQKLCSADSDTQVIVVQPECAVGETVIPKSSSAGMKAIDSDCQYYDVTLMMADGTLQTISLPAQLVVPGTPKNQTTTTAATTTSQIIITRNPDEKPAVNATANTQIDGVVTSVKNSVVSTPSASDGKLYSTTAVKTDVATTTQLPRQMSCNSRVRLTPIVLPSGDKTLPMASGSSQPISRAGLTPEMLHDRITQLISSNAAIVDTPMADAPRPKRVSRHNSMFEPMLISSPQVTIATALILPNSGTQVLPLEAARKPAKLTPVKSNGSNFLGQVEPTDQPPGGSGNLPSSMSGPGLTFTTLPATNEIKIEIRLPKPATTVSAACSPVNIPSPSVSGTGQSVTESGQSGGITAPVMAVEHSVIKDLLLKGRSQSLPSNVELVTPGGVSVASEVSHSDSSLKCAACHQTFCDAGSLDEHMKQSCPAKQGQVFVVKAPEPTLLCLDNTTIVTSSMPVITPSVTTATKPSMKTHTVVMTTAMTGGSTMLLEVVDPTVPPKRGRPKGSRNSYNSPVSKPSPPPNPALFPTYPSLAPRPPKDSQTDSTPLKPPGRPPRPVLRLKIPPPHGFASNHVTKGTLSAGLSPGSSSDLPTTPITSFAKLKLKGKILMKRSMSVERMLLQDKSGSSAGSAVSCLPLSSSVQTAPIRQKFLTNLRRCESLDESMPLTKRVRLQEQPDSGKLDSLLYKMLMKGLISSTPGGSTTNFMMSPISMANKPAVQATPSTSDAPDVIIIDDGLTDDDPHPPNSSGATLEVFTYPPVNVGMTIAARLAVANVAPFARGISADVMLHFPSVESLPDNLMSGIPGLLLRVVTGCARKMDSLSMPDTGGTVKEKVGATPDPDVEPEGENGSVKTSDSAKTDLTLTDARPKMLESATKCSAELPVGIAEKAAAVQLLLSHSYPILCNRTHVTFCTVLKPQPTYIRQSTNDLSMYSNWKTPVSDAPGSDLTSRMMLSLYEMRRRVETPFYINSCRPVSILTHSSYWNGVSPPSPAPPIVTTRHSIPSSSESKPKSPSELDLISVALNEVEVTCENVSSEIAVPSGSRIVRLLHESVAPPMDTPKRVVIFSGGYKTSEEYVYVRGRGRGHYVCERCGIRCKKPSMLKKHIRTHTDLRPYHCYYCSFSFKTKGNLTKHMKSKAHHKKCLELGIFPIPTVVDETHIDSSALDQQNQVAEESRILGACVDDTDGSHLTDDNDGDDDDNDDDEEEDDDTESEAEMVIDDDVDSVNSRSDVQYVAMVPDGSTEAAFLKMKADVKTELKRENVASENTKFTLGQVKGQPPRASIDKEIAASLLDLSKGTDDVCKMTTTAESGLASTRCSSGHTGVVGPVTSVTCESVGAPPVNQREDTTVSTQCCSPPICGTTEGTPMSMDEVPDHISPASRIWLDNMRAFCERAHTHMPKTEHDSNIGARFVPPLPTGGTPAKTSTESTNVDSVHRPIISSASGGPIIGHFIKQDVSLANILNMMVTDTVSSAKDLPQTMTQSSAVTLQTACITTAVSHVNKSTDTCVNETPVTDGVVKQTVQHTQPDNVERTTEDVAMTSVSVETVAMPSVTMATTAIPTVAIATVTTAMTQPAQPIPFHLLGLHGLPAVETVAMPSVTMATTAIPTVAIATVTTAMTQLAQTIPFHLLGLHGLPAVVPSEIPLGVLLVTTASATPLTSSTATVVQFVTGDNRAPYEIIPIPGRVNDNSASLVDGKYVCHVCGKTFPKQHQLTLHKNIHYFERPFKCTDCSLSFRTKGHLEKHHKSEGHQLKVKVAERSQAAQVTVTSGGSVDNPRPFRCDDCNVAFRIHGHLAKHLRSKLHIIMLEKLGKVPPGAYALIEKNGSFKEVIATDCETSLQCIRRLLVNLDGGGSTSHSTCDSGLLAHVPAEISQSSVTSSGQTGSVSESAVDSFTYCRAGEFEKVTNASNDRVTVERKAELIDFGEFVPETETVSQLTGEGRAGLAERGREGGGTCATAAVEHQCSLCRSDFPDISSLKQHLVTHTELRPYVCEYCDAGFTTAQSLTFHLRTHTQERPYLCGRCGDTFARLSQLQQHSLVHTSQSLGGTTAQSPDGATSQSLGGATSQSLHGATSQSLDGATSQSLGGATSQSLDGTTLQPLDGATSDSPGGAPSHLPGGATQTAAVAMVTASLCKEVAINKDRVERMLPPNGGDVSREGVSDRGVGGVCRQTDVSKTPGSGVEGDTPVTTTCVNTVSGVSVTNNNTATVDTHRYPVSVAMVTTAGGNTASVTATFPSQPSENHVSKTSLNPASKRRCLQRQCAMTGEDVTMATAAMSSSDGVGATCVTTADTVATPVDDIGQCSSSQHSYDQTEQSKNVPCSSSVP